MLQTIADGGNPGIMEPPWADRRDAYIHLIKEIQKEWITYDIHLHPVEIIYNYFGYSKDLKVEGVYRTGNAKYVKPSHDQPEDLDTDDRKTQVVRERKGIFRLFVQKAYSHTGPRVFRDFFDLNGIDKGLLLPVAPKDGPIEGQMKAVAGMFGKDKQFRLAGSVPNTVKNEDVREFISSEKKHYNIAAVKIHPDITGIDLGSREGKGRLECILDGASNIGIPAIIHVGRNNLPGSENGRFSEVQNLKDINLIAKSRVVLAHGGIYGYSLSEIGPEMLNPLNNILNKWPNVLIDISALDWRAIKVLSRSIGADRILFGSDGLYYSQGLMLVNLVRALLDSGSKVEEALVKILSVNAATQLFGEDPKKRRESCA